MLIQSLLSLALLRGSIVTPVQVEKRAVPRLGGVNLAGCDFGISTDGSSGTSYCPSTDQITHFAADGANLFRLPFGWQYMVSNNPSSTSLDSTFFAQYDTLVQAVLKTGGYAMLDVHNYARWNGGTVGQGGPSDADLASLWKLLAGKYQSQSRVIFGIMNEPHDLDVSKWANTVQASVNAIRAAGATSQLIALPGTFWAHADAYLDGSNAPILKITDPAGDGSLLILDVHQYLDGDGSGQSTECTTNGVDKLTSMTNFLKTNNRRAILSETGGGNTASCQTDLGQEGAYVAQNSDVWVGFAAWAAGSFDASYVLSLTPANGQDNALFKAAVQPYLPGNSAPPTSTTSSSSAARAFSSSSSRPISSSSKPAITSTTPKSVSLSTVTSPSKSVTSSSATPKTSSSSTTTKATTTTSSSLRSNPASSSTSTSSPAAGTGAGGNLQTFKGALGGISAPAVTKSGNTYTSAGRTFNFLHDALEGSCYKQMDLCQSAANQGGNKGDLTVQACNGQVQACLAAAQS